MEIINGGESKETHEDHYVQGQYQSNHKNKLGTMVCLNMGTCQFQIIQGTTYLIYL